MTKGHKTKAGTTAGRSALALAACAVALVVTGCVTGGSLYAPETPAYLPGSPINGRAMGGQQPVTGSVVQLYAVGTGALGTAATPLITSTSVLGGTGIYPVTTDSNGYFGITGDYSCAGNPQVYLTVTYGKSITAAAASHPNLALVAALGPCSSLSSSTFIIINEVTTVAAGYALAPFWGADYAHVAGPNSTAIANAMTTANTLVNYSTGSTPGAGLPANTAIKPSGLINSLANALSSCVNSDPNTDAAPCNTLLGLAQNAAGTTPTDTATAAANIAANPGNNAASLFNVIPSVGAPFGNPQLSTTPQDWTLALKYTDSSLAAPYGVAIDASGNAWVTNEGGFSVTKITAGTGAIASGASGYTGGGNVDGPQGIAVDKSGNVWVANTLGGSIVELSSSGALVGNYTSASLVAPVAVAVDSGGNAWAANLNGNSIVKVSSGGSVGLAISGGRSGGSFKQPSSIAVDKSGNVWTANLGYGNVVEFSNAGTELSSTTTGVTDSNTIAPTALAVDMTLNAPAGNVWLASMGTGALDGFTNSGTALAAAYAGGGLSAPMSVAVDGGSNVWAVNGNSTTGTLTKLAYGGGSYAATTPSSGLGALNNPVGVAVDGGGNVWVADHGDNSVTEFIGIGTPVTTPLAANAGP